jgi:transposase
MLEPNAVPTRYIGLDIHRDYFVAVGVDVHLQSIFGPQTVPNQDLEAWIERCLSPQDAVVLEMTTNTYLFFDLLEGKVRSVTAVHPPNVALVVRAPVKTDKKAALTLAQLHAAGLLEGVWIPPQAVRDLRAVIAQRNKMVRLSTIAKNRLTAVLHRNHLKFVGPKSKFTPEQREWWESLPLTEMERLRVSSDLNTLEFAEKQTAQIEAVLRKEAAKDERVPLLVQLPGIAWLTALTILGAIGIIERFEDAKHLVGYAGLGTRVHDSGLTHQNGRITKAGRKDLRRAMVDAANHAIVHHHFWKKEFERLEPRLGRSKAVVAIARRLLVVVWHVLSKATADRHADARDVACSFFAHAYKVGVRNLPGGLSAKAFTRQQLDRLGIGWQLQVIPWGSRKEILPPSTLPQAQQKK